MNYGLNIEYAGLVHSHSVLTPSEYVAYERQPEVTFQCTVTVPGLKSIGVHVDGEQLGTTALSDRGITISGTVTLGDTYQRNITISAIQANKNTTIECFVPGAGNDTATFMVQGRSYYHNYRNMCIYA